MPRSARASSTSTRVVKPAVWRSHSASVAEKRPVCSGRPTLLWVDDFQPGLALYRSMFEGLGFKVLTATSGKQGVRLAAENHIDVVVTDYEMPGMNGEALAVAIKAIKPRVPVVLFSGSTLVPLSARRIIDAFCDKAGSRNQLSNTIQRVLLKKRIRTLQPPSVARASDEGRRTVA
ncbi:MAG TPA: response regulator [Terriglobales bacterium]|jgi:CheY-like chemotaxis protein|nr:response regulator [Terriglobales bacterium]